MTTLPLSVETVRYIALGWYGFWSLLALWCTISDKRRARTRRWRIPEAWLLGIGAVGGAPVMLCCMLAIRHKTRHAKFMLILPVFTVLHAAVLYLLWRQ